MAISNDQKIDKLFKSSLQSGDTLTGRDFFVEDSSPQNIIGSQVWVDEVPKLCPESFQSNFFDGTIVSNIELIKEMRLELIPGSQYSFAPVSPEDKERFRDIIPFTYDNSYAFSITDGNGEIVNFGAGDWILDCSQGVLRFYDPSLSSFTLLNNSYFLITCYKYVGEKGFANIGGGGGSGLDGFESESVNVLKQSLTSFEVIGTSTAVPQMPPTNVVDDDINSFWLASRTYKESLIFKFTSAICLKRITIKTTSCVSKTMYVVGSSQNLPPEYNEIIFFNDIVAGTKPGYDVLTIHETSADKWGTEEGERFTAFMLDNTNAYTHYWCMFLNVSGTGASGIMVADVKGYETEGAASKGVFIDEFEEGYEFKDIVLKEGFDEHLTDEENPHKVTSEQSGSVSVEDFVLWKEENFDVHLADEENPHSVDKADIGLGNVINAEQLTLSMRGVADGVCDLDSIGKIPSNRLPDSIVGGLNFAGEWNPTYNLPSLSDGGGGGFGGDYYICSVDEDDRPIDGTSVWATGDWVLHNGTTWTKIENSGSVHSVNGKSGIVTLNSDEVDEGLNNKYFTNDNLLDATGYQTNRTDIDNLQTLVGGGIDGSKVYVDTDDEAGVPEFGQVLPSDDQGSYVSGYRLFAHLTDTDRHNAKNDTLTSAVTLWSSEKIVDYIENTFTIGHETDLENPHQTTKTQVGLSDVENLRTLPSIFLYPDLSVGTAIPTPLNIDRVKPGMNEVSGIPWLDNTGKIPSDLLSFHGNLRFLGAWEPDTNFPELTDAMVMDHLEGDYYVCVTNGSTTLGGNSTWVVGDWVMRLDDVWYRVHGSHLVVRVNDKIGIVELNSNDIPEEINATLPREDDNNLYYKEERVANNWRMRRTHYVQDFFKHFLNNDTSIGLETTIDVDYPDEEPIGADPTISVSHSTVNPLYTSAEEIREHLQSGDFAAYGDGRPIERSEFHQSNNPHDTRFGTLKDVPEYRTLRKYVKVEYYEDGIVTLEDEPRDPEEPGYEPPFFVEEEKDFSSGYTDEEGEVESYEVLNQYIDNYTQSNAQQTINNYIFGSGSYNQKFDAGAALFGCWHLSAEDSRYGERPEVPISAYEVSYAWSTADVFSGAHPHLPIQDEWMKINFVNKTIGEEEFGVIPEEWHWIKTGGDDEYFTIEGGKCINQDEYYNRTDGFKHAQGIYYSGVNAGDSYEYRIAENLSGEDDSYEPLFGTYPAGRMVFNVEDQIWEWTDGYDSGEPPFVHDDGKSDLLLPTPVMPQAAYTPIGLKARNYLRQGKVVNCVAIFAEDGCKDFTIYGSYNDEDWHRLYTGEQENQLGNLVLHNHDLNGRPIYPSYDQNNRWMEKFCQFHYFLNSVPFRFYKVVVHNAHTGHIRINKIFFLNHNASKVTGPSDDWKTIKLKDIFSPTMAMDHLLDFENPHKITPYRIGAPSRKEFFDLWVKYDQLRSNYERTKAENVFHIDNRDNPHEVNKDQVGLGYVDNTKQIPWSSRGMPGGVAILGDIYSSLPGRISYDLLPETLDPDKGIVDTVISNRTDLALSANRGKYLYGEIQKSDSRNVVSSINLDMVLNHCKANPPAIGRVYFSQDFGDLLVCKKEIPDVYDGLKHNFPTWENTRPDLVTFTDCAYNGLIYCKDYSNEIATILSQTFYTDYTMEAVFGAQDSYDSGTGQRLNGFDHFGMIVSYINSSDFIAVVRSSGFDYNTEYLAIVDCSTQCPLADESRDAQSIRGTYDNEVFIDGGGNYSGDPVYLVLSDDLEPGPAPLPGDPDYEEGNSTPYYWWYNSPAPAIGRIVQDMNGNESFAVRGSLIINHEGEWKVFVSGHFVFDQITNRFFSIKHVPAGSSNTEVYTLNSNLDFILFSTPPGANVFSNMDDPFIGVVYRLQNTSSQLAYWNSAGSFLDEDLIIFNGSDWSILKSELSLFNESDGNPEFSYVVRKKTDNSFHEYDRNVRGYVETELLEGEVSQQLRVVHNFGLPSETVLSVLNLSSEFISPSRSFHNFQIERISSVIKVRISRPDSTTLYSDWVEYGSVEPRFDDRRIGVLFLNSPKTVLESLYVQKNELVWDEQWITNDYFIYANLRTELLLEDEIDLGDSGSITKALTERTLNVEFNVLHNLNDSVITLINNHSNLRNNPHQITKAQIGLGSVTNEQAIPISLINTPNGVCPLGDNGQIPDVVLAKSGLVYSDDNNEFVDPAFIPYGQILGVAQLDNEGLLPWDGLHLDSGKIPDELLEDKVVRLEGATLSLAIIPILNSEKLPTNVCYLDSNSEVAFANLKISEAIGGSGAGTPNSLIQLDGAGKLNGNFFSFMIVQTGTFSFQFLDEGNLDENGNIENAGPREGGSVEHDFTEIKLDSSILMTNVNNGVLKLDDVGKAPLEHMPCHAESYGLAGVNEAGYLLMRHMPPEYIGALTWIGVWNAETNEPELANNGVGGRRGWYYVVSNSGSTSLNGVSDWQVGDWIINSGGAWYKLDNNRGVLSFNEMQGDVEVTTDDIPEGDDNEYYTDERVSENSTVAGLVAVSHERNGDVGLNAGGPNAITAFTIKEHVDSRDNPHELVCSTISATSQQDFDDHLANIENPHSVSFKQGVDNKTNGYMGYYNLFSAKCLNSSTTSGGAHGTSMGPDKAFDGNPSTGFISQTNSDVKIICDFGFGNRQKPSKLRLYFTGIQNGLTIEGCNIIDENDEFPQELDWVEIYTNTGEILNCEDYDEQNPEDDIINYEIGVSPTNYYRFLRFSIVSNTESGININFREIEADGERNHLGFRYDSNGDVVYSNMLPYYTQLKDSLEFDGIEGGGGGFNAVAGDGIAFQEILVEGVATTQIDADLTNFITKPDIQNGQITRAKLHGLAEGEMYLFLDGALRRTSFNKDVVPAGTINGINANFILNKVPFDLHVYVNGLYYSEGATNDYTLNNMTIIFTAGSIPQTGSVIRCNFKSYSDADGIDDVALGE